MPKTALIIEDDEAIAKLLAGVCGQLGLEHSIVRNGREGFEAAHERVPDLVLLDLLVPGLDGFRVAEGLRTAGLDCAIVAVSGVYKDAKVTKEFVDRYDAEFFPKPFRVEDVSAAICRRLKLAPPARVAPPVATAAPRAGIGTPIAPLPAMEGTLREQPLPGLLMQLFRARASGTLDLAHGQARRRIVLHRGLVRFAQSNLKAENVGGMQVAEGTLSEDAFRSAVARARAQGIGVGQALLAAGALGADALAKATRRQVEAVVGNAFAWTEASYRFAPGDTESVQDAHQDPIALLLAAYRHHVAPDAARARLAALGAGVVARGADFDRCHFTARAVFPGETVTPMINGRLALGDLLGRARPADLPLVLALLEMGFARLAATPGAQAVPRNATPMPGSLPALDLTPCSPQERAARALVAAEFERVMNAPDLFAVLGLGRGAGEDEARSAYLALAKRFHTDSFSGLNLGDAAEQLRELFARIAEAHSTLTDPRQRADYIVLLERKEAGLPTDVEVIFKAEAAFVRGDALVGQGRFGEAEASLREALKLDPGVAQYHAALGQALLKGRGPAGAAEARQVLEKALALNPGLVAAKAYLATAIALEGDARSAEKLLREVLAAHPDQPDAQREYRALKERSSKGEGKGGLLGKLFGRQA